MRRQPRWNKAGGRSKAGAPGARRRRAVSPTLEDLESRVVMSTSGISGVPASVAQIATRASVASDGRVAIGDGVGAMQVVVETWKNTPYVFMINTNHDLFFGHLAVWQSTTAPWNSYPAFSGWTFVAGAAKDIAVDTWQGTPYIFMIDGADNLYYGNLSTVASTKPPWTGQDVFTGWHYLASAAKDVTASQWNGNEYVYMTTTSNDLDFGYLYTKPGTTYPPTPSQTLFSGWNYLTGAVNSVSVDVWRNAPYVYLIDGSNNLYYGNLYFDPKAPAVPGQIPTPKFSGWNFVLGAAKSVVVSQWNNSPYLYLINLKNDLYQGHLSASGTSSTVPPGPSQFSGWSYLASAAKSISVNQWNGRPILYLINANNELYYRYWYTVRTEIAHWTYADVPVLSGWIFLIGAANQVTTGTWQNNPYIFLTNTKNDLYQGHIYNATAKVAPWNTYVTFSGWSAL